MGAAAVKSASRSSLPADSPAAIIGCSLTSLPPVTVQGSSRDVELVLLVVLGLGVRGAGRRRRRRARCAAGSPDCSPATAIFTPARTV